MTLKLCESSYILCEDGDWEFEKCSLMDLVRVG